MYLFFFFPLSEVVTRLSSLCCENMAQSGAISKIFVLIRSCNRSVPCMEVIGYAVQVLLNVAKVVSVLITKSSLVKKPPPAS